MAEFNRGLDGKFVEKLNEEYEKKEAGWWSQFVDDEDLFLAIRDNAVDVYCRGCTLIHLEWRPRKEKIVANTHYKYLLRPEKVKPEYVDVGGGKPRIDASAYFSDRLDVEELKKAAAVYAGDEKKGVHDILLKNHYVLDVEVAISDGEEVPRIDFAALQQGEAGQTHIVFYEAKHFGNKELRSKDGKVDVIEQIGEYRQVLKRHCRDIEKSYCRVAENLRALKGVRCRHPERHDLLKKTKRFIVEKQPGLVVFGFDNDQKEGSVWGNHRNKLEELLRERKPILRGNAAGVKIPT